MLNRYKIESKHLLGHGMESDVYVLDDARVLKIYHRPPSIQHLQTLQFFYRHLDTSKVPFTLPFTEEVDQDGTIIYTIEKRLYGRNMELVSREVDLSVLDQLLYRYIHALQDFSKTTFNAPLTQYKLFDEIGESLINHGDWHAYMRRYMHRRVENTITCFKKDVVALDEKLQRLDQILSIPYTGQISVIHGDFYPGNLLVDENMVITGLLDFGLFTMFGDHLFDVATACVFFDMYDQLGQNIRPRLLSIAAELYGSSTLGILYRYILIYSLLAANIFAPDCSDGQYQWSVANLNNHHYWENIQ